MKSEEGGRDEQKRRGKVESQKRKEEKAGMNTLFAPVMMSDTATGNTGVDYEYIQLRDGKDYKPVQDQRHKAVCPAAN